MAVKKLHEGLDFDVQNRLMHELYNAIGDVMFKFRRYDITKNDFEMVVDEVVLRFLDGEDFDFEE